MDKTLSKLDLQLMLEIIHESLQCNSDAEFEGLVDMARKLLNFDYIRSLFGDSGKYANEKMAALKMITSFPKEWEARYNERDYFLHDNIAVTAYNTVGLFCWEDFVEIDGANAKVNKKSREIMQEAGEFGLKNGWLFSLIGQRSSERAILSLGGEQCEQNERARKILEYLSPHLCLAVKRIVLNQKKNCPKLTTREREVLTWTASGKTAWEISTILNISRRTVEFHMGNILKNLDAVNSQQAIAIALTTGLIQY